MPKSKRKRIYYNLSEKFEPVNAIGKLLFFDYNKKKFGIISEIKYGNLLKLKEVYVLESDISSKKPLYKGETVTFILNKGQNGFYATQVNSFDEINLKNISAYDNLVSIDEIEKAIANTTKSDYKSLDFEDKKLIADLFLEIDDTKAWEGISKLQDVDLENAYILRHINKLKDIEKLAFLKKSFNYTLLNNILSNWTTQEKVIIFNLMETIGSNDLKLFHVPNSYIKILCSSEWTFNEIWKIYCVFKGFEIANQFLKLFSFKDDNAIERLKIFLSENTLDENILNKLKANLISGKVDISGNRLIEIYTELSDYQIIENENKLLELLSGRVLNDSSFTDLITLLNNDCNLTDFRKIITNSIENITLWEILDHIELYRQKNELIIVLIDEYYTYESKNPNPDYWKLFNFFKDEDSSVLRKHFIDKFYKELSSKFPIEILELSILSNHVNAQTLAYQNITFDSEDEILSFVDKFENINICDEVKTSNKPLTSFLAFLKGSSNFNFTEDCKKFFQTNTGFVQCLTVKFLIYQFHKQKINKAKLSEILNSFQWTEISAILIIAFVEESNNRQNILLDKLKEIIQTHFDVLSTRKYEAKSFLNNFTIQNILSRCDGRKYYDINHWERNGISRDYVKGIIRKEFMDCFCEGRPMKRKIMWDSDTKNKKEYEIYWCKTSYCAARNDLIDLNQPFQNWTLSEIAGALNITIEKIALATLAGWANRMNQIVEHLFCRVCNEVLRPLPFRPRTLGYYAVPLFHCINDKCSEKQTIRFTHCLNNKCESHKTSEPLDSRDCESCRPNDINHIGLKCNYCGASCPECSGHHQRVIAQEVW